MIDTVRTVLVMLCAIGAMSSSILSGKVICVKSTGHQAVELGHNHGTCPAGQSKSSPKQHGAAEVQSACADTVLGLQIASGYGATEALHLKVSPVFYSARSPLRTLLAPEPSLAPVNTGSSPEGDPRDGFVLLESTILLI